MGLCPLIFWYIAGNYVQLHATPNLRDWLQRLKINNTNIKKAAELYITIYGKIFNKVCLIVKFPSTTSNKILP